MRQVRKSNAPRRLFLGVFSVVAGLGVALLIAEIVLRIAPIPGIELDANTYDDAIGQGFYPGSTLTHRTGTGAIVQRRVNQSGFLDRDHPDKTGGVYRIGFFGDSYTEARQVPLAQTFFRIIETELYDEKVETLAFGISGLSMFQSYLNYQKWVDIHGIDMVVYVFVENDLGDQIRSIARSAMRPYPILTDQGIISDDSFKSIYNERDTLLRRFGDYLTARSVVFATISARLLLLRRYGIKMAPTPEDLAMSGGNPEGFSGPESYPDQNDRPSNWPPALREQAIRLGEAVLRDWVEDAVQRSKKLVVAYIPRGPDLGVDAGQQDSWKLWLETYCRQQGIEFFDPSNALAIMEKSGTKVIADHFTRAGHRAFALAFADWFRARQAKNDIARRYDSPVLGDRGTAIDSGMSESVSRIRWVGSVR